MTATTTLTYDGTTIDLPGDIQWTDEFAWSPVVQQSEYASDGTLILEETLRQAGRHITLSTGAFALVSRATVDALRGWESMPGIQMTLVLADGVSRAVQWRRPGIQARPWQDYHIAPPASDDPFTVTLNFLEI
jgi:hypothetical protein